MLTIARSGPVQRQAANDVSGTEAGLSTRRSRMEMDGQGMTEQHAAGGCLPGRLVAWSHAGQEMDLHLVAGVLQAPRGRLTCLHAAAPLAAMSSCPAAGKIGTCPRSRRTIAHFHATEQLPRPRWRRRSGPAACRRSMRRRRRPDASAFPCPPVGYPAAAGRRHCPMPVQYLLTPFGGARSYKRTLAQGVVEEVHAMVVIAI